MREAILAALLLTAACAGTNAEPQPAPPAGAAAASYDLAAQRARIARIPMAPNTAFLNAEEKDVVNLLIRAGDLMSEIYLRQRFADNPRIRAEIARSQHPQKAALLDMFDLHFGPWDTLAENHPFYGGEAMPAGAGFYPTDLTKEAFEAYLVANPGEKEALTSGYTVVKRRGGKLVAVPYSIEYRQWLEPAARLLEQAARRTSNASLRKFLTLRPRPSAPTIITNPSSPGWT